MRVTVSPEKTGMGFQMDKHWFNVKLPSVLITVGSYVYKDLQTLFHLTLSTRKQN